ncbi:MAG: VTT domain-containing protein [Mariprofundaceae bacterium]
MAAQYVFDIASYFETARIKDWLAEAGVFAPLLLMLAMAGAVVISPIPSLPLDIAAGAFFGPWLGTLYASIGATAGAVASFIIARLLGRQVLERFLSGVI